MAPTR
ncbi:hypothetical protein ECPA10_2415, partial [Escherichia coli PA10]